METKQTAVEQIYCQIEVDLGTFWNESMLIDWLKEHKQGYIKEEKEQMIKFAQIVLNKAKSSHAGIVYIERYIEEYYNETYKQQDK
jgi:hypothetical protein